MDNKAKTGRSDASRINVNEEYELQYWSEKFDVSKDRLKDAVKAVGTNATDVERYFQSR